MTISATLHNRQNENHVVVVTNDNSKQLNIPAKANGAGSAINGGELLFLALATCFCNDIYREAAKRNLKVNSVEVKVTGEFGGEGETGSNIRYQTKLDCPELDESQIQELIEYVDRIAEVHNTIRKGVDVKLVS